MEQLHYKITINAPKQIVWNTMLDPESYKQWVKTFSPNSQYEGQWLQDSTIKFIDPNMGGTKALLEIVKPFEHIHARHVAILNKDGTEDTESEIANKWIGVTETYQLKDVNDGTELSIYIFTHEEFIEMFNDGWPTALEVLKGLCEGDDG